MYLLGIFSFRCILSLKLLKLNANWPLISLHWYKVGCLIFHGSLKFLDEFLLPISISEELCICLVIYFLCPFIMIEFSLSNVIEWSYECFVNFFSYSFTKALLWWRVSLGILVGWLKLLGVMEIVTYLNLT